MWKQKWESAEQRPALLRQPLSQFHMQDMNVFMTNQQRQPIVEVLKAGYLIGWGQIQADLGKRKKGRPTVGHVVIIRNDQVSAHPRSGTEKRHQLFMCLLRQGQNLQ